MKIFQKITALAISALTALSLAVSASASLADQGNGGAFDGASYGSYAYGWKSGADLMWLMDVYVATTDDGLIDTSKMSVTSDLSTGNIEYMGTMLYTNGYSGNCIMPTKSYISERISGISTTPISVATDPYHTAMQYKLPQTTASDNFSTPFFSSSSNTFTYVTKFGERQIHVFNSEPHGLPTSISGSYNYATTKSIIESDQFTEDIVKDLKHCIGEATLNYAVLSAISAKRPVNKDDFSALYPDSDDPIVQWAVVATPLALNTANAGTDIGFWITKDKTTDPNSPTLDVVTVQQYGSITYAMDAYTQAWYNGLTHTMLSSKAYREELSDRYNISLAYLNTGSGSSAVNTAYPAQDSTYTDWGLLRKEYGTTNYEKLADIAYVDAEKWPEHCLGIFSPKNYSDFDWHKNKNSYAQFGGITIALSKMDDTTSIPVYYYITPTPDKPVQTDPKSVSVSKPFTPNPPEDTTVTRVIIPDTPFTNTTPDNPPSKFPTGTLADKYIVDPNPDGTYPIKPDNPPYILVECVPAIPVYYHTFTFLNESGQKYDDVFAFLEDNPDITEADASETVTKVGAVKALSYKGQGSYSLDNSSRNIVAAISTSGTKENRKWNTLITDYDYAKYMYSFNWTSVGEYRKNPATTPVGSNKSIKYYGKSAPQRGKSATASIHVKLYALAGNNDNIVIKENPLSDRIKTFDLTQFIDQTIGGIAESSHLKKLTTYTYDTSSYNSSAMDLPNSTHDTNNGAWLKSDVLSFDTHQQVQATNYLDQVFSTCSGGSCSHWVDPYTDENGVYHSGYYKHTNSSNTKYKCHYAKEDVKTGFGLSVSQIQRTEDKTGAISQISGWKNPSALAAADSFTTVGFTIPTKYYSDPDVVKLYGSAKDDTDSSGVFLVPNISKNVNNANPLAVFDVLLSKDRYNIAWYSNSTEVKYQSASASNVDKEEDYNQSIGDLQFKYTAGKNFINGVQYIAHRDLLSGDEVSTSLAVSGYMLKYADTSSSLDYIKLMSNAGFVFKGASNADTITSNSELQYDSANIKTIGHENRTVWIANASKLTDLAASQDGATKNAYNTNYTHGSQEQYKVRVGLGGASADAVNMYSKYIKNSSKLRDGSLDTTAEDGDALRSIYYYGQESEDSNTTACHGYWASASHTKDCTSHSDSPATHASVDVKPKWTSVSNNNYVCKTDQNLTNGIYASHSVFNKVQNDMFTDIYTSRESFSIPLAVEGTTAGKYDSEGKDGIKYNTDLLTLDNGVLRFKTLAELSKAKKSVQESQASYEKTTFEIKDAEYATVGSVTKRKDKNDLLAEYRYTVPTRTYTFNPSFYMQFDDTLADNNKSVWMLSNQPRRINFKNILSIRLLQSKESEGNTKDGAAGGYPTVINSAWSTDNEDVTIQKETKLPVMKAGNSYSTETATSGGTITAYVILQDPEFTGNPDDTQKNEQILAEYSAEMNKLLQEMGCALVSAPRSSAGNADAKNSLGFAMYTNMTNGSSVNSGLQVHTNVEELNEKEPMVITHGTNHVYSTGWNPKTLSVTDSLNNWTFYALKGNEVYPRMNNGKITVNGYEKADTDISDTTSSGNRKFLGCSVESQSAASGHVAETLTEINNRLKTIMINGQNTKIAAPSSTKPYDASEGGSDFSWYVEDYEGFIVAVYEIDFTLSGDDKDINNNKDTTAGIITDFSAAYRHESDWRTAANNNAVDYDLNDEKVSSLRTLSYTEGIVNNTYVHNSNISLSKNGRLQLLTTGKDSDAQEILDKWAKSLAGKKINYTAAIYGIGLELANVPIEFGSTTEGTGKIGNSTIRMSFYYQPTYFNVRGSVYDTTH